MLQIIKHHAIVLFKLLNGIYPHFMPVEKVRYQRNHIIPSLEKHFNVIMILVHHLLRLGNSVFEFLFKRFFFLQKTLAKDGPVPWSSDDNVTFIAEQTSHHPPSNKRKLNQGLDLMNVCFFL